MMRVRGGRHSAGFPGSRGVDGLQRRRHRSCEVVRVAKEGGDVPRSAQSCAREGLIGCSRTGVT
jgi:ribosomal protein L15